MSASDDGSHSPEPGSTGARRDVAAELRLRPDPPRVMRLSRRVLSVLVAVAGLGLGAVLIFALQDRGGLKDRETWSRPAACSRPTSCPACRGTMPRSRGSAHRCPVIRATRSRRADALADRSGAATRRIRSRRRSRRAA